MEKLKITFFTEKKQKKCKTIDIDQGMNMTQLKNILIRTFFLLKNRVLISDLKMTKIFQKESKISINLFDQQYDSEDAYQLLKNYSNCRIYFEDIRYTIGVNVFNAFRENFMTIPLILQNNYNNIINSLSSKLKINPEYIYLFTKNEKKISPNDDIRLLRHIGINAFIFPIQVNFIYQEKTYEMKINENQSISEIKKMVQNSIINTSNDIVFQINDDIIDDNDSKIYDLFKLYKTCPLIIDITLQSEIDKIKKLIAKMQTDEIVKINDENQKLKHKLDKMIKIIQTKDEIIEKNKEEIEKLHIEIDILGKLKQLKKKKKDIVTYKNDEYKNNQSIIGHGGYCTVYKVTKDHEYAMKTLNQCAGDSDGLKRFINESKFLFALRHPCIIRIHGFNEGNKEICPSMILSLEPQSLEQAIESNKLQSKIDKCRIAVEVVLGMRYIHSKKIIHRDLKPSNILLSKNNHVRICDFGISKVDDPNISKTNTTGSLRFMAPELILGEEKVNYDGKIDVYAFGHVLFYIVTNKLPPFSYAKVVKGIIPCIPKNVAEWIGDLITKCLSFKSENRPSFDEIFDTMKNHNYDLFSDDPQISFDNAVIKERVEKIEAFEVLNGD